MKKILIVLLSLSTAFTAIGAVKQQILTSPDGKLKIEINTGDGLVYSLSHEGVQLLAPSEISMTFDNNSIVYGKNGKVRKSTRRSVDEIVAAPIYRKASLRDRFNEITLVYKHCRVIFRAYNEGMAYRFVSQSDTPFKVISEQADFVFPEDYKAYIPYVTKKNSWDEQFFNSFENHYTHSKISSWETDRLAFLPLLVECAQGKKICITEANLTDYPGMYLHNGDASAKLSAVFARYPKQLEQGGYNNLQMVVKDREDFIAKYDKGETAFPWRVVAVSSNDAELTDNDMVYLLADEVEENADFSWVKPGKVAWDWWNDWNISGVDFKSGVNNDTYKYYIDFAAANGIEYVILDEGWAVNLKADLFQVVPAIDLEELTAYADERGVGLILWAGYQAFDRDMEAVCKHYSEMGIKGFKVDFMDRDDQLMVDFEHRAAQICAKYHMLLDLHGSFKPSGISRTYPNVINYEGVFGLEQMKWIGPECDQVTYEVIIPFVRMLAGPMDYTQGAMRNATKDNYRGVWSEAMSQGTRCRQLAEYVIFDSPLNMLCDSPSNYMREGECLEFISKVPTFWDDSRSLDGRIGEYLTMARRSKDIWYLASMTNWQARDIEIDLSFLGDGKYSMEIFRDGTNADRIASDYKREIIDVPTSRKIRLHMAPGGGFAAKITLKH